jgi:uncharacterized protein YkwD
MNIGRLGGIYFLLHLFFSFFFFTGCSKKTSPSKNIAAEKRPDRFISTEGMEVKILYYENMYRRSVGKTPVQLNSFESSVALQHCKNMAEGRTPFGHKGLELRKNAIERKLGSVSVTAENVAYGQLTASEVVDGWMHSSLHRKNIEGNFILTGIGWAKDSHGMIYYTQIFTR